ncbi:hypothetical protein [Luteibacter yeojuensis]|nr:hypothetical protein [Luteibacter yeojuensis]
MKYETAMLKTFFVAAVLTCLLTLGAMVTAPAPVTAQAIAAIR